MESVQRTKLAAGRPRATPFVLAFAVLVMAAVVLATMPVYAGADPAYLTVLTPVFQWVPFLAILVLHAVHRSRVRQAPGGEAGEAPWRLWAASGATLRGRSGSILAVSLVALIALVITAVVPLLASGAAGMIELRWVEGAALAALLTLPVAVVFMIPVAGEELAWRGYLTSLLSRHRFAATTALIGGLWALWHLPLLAALAHAGELDGRDVVSKTIDLLLAAVLVSALRYLSGSVWPAVFAHALFNNLFQMVQYNFMEPLSSASASGYWGYMAVSWVTWLIVDAVLVVWVYRRTGGRLDL
ncbi:CPBP family glutamic-type intramembrane protease [Nesterenkonia sp. CL21]|uniref:CPBP family glutamic-type intramembrane protease n=1 Tax=Nesterenkonia sp. CL21 TaxID=3064894 RepID=UPI0028785D18|nr:CPBP family glutamic-type intramembrane protease [Nesterenkonia sp. CL21]MDS2174157.1 CPBP family glutamic-type intramembrane protease [Nesterenkonia sp. CL21]